MENPTKGSSRIQYADDVEMVSPRRMLSRELRRNSIDSVHSTVSGRRVIDPDIILPVHYRTLWVS
jgi:hypothetical protein